MSILSLNDKIFVAGASGMVGNALCKFLIKKGFKEENNKLLKSTKENLDLRNHSLVYKWFEIKKPDIVIIAAAKVGGIIANRDYPVEFLLDNLKIQNNLIEAAFNFKVKRLLFLGSSCIYPKFSQQPIKERYLLEGHLESSNQFYALAKIAGIKLCEAYRKQYNFDTISLMPTNLYGPYDNYHEKNSHVMASLIRKFHEAKINNIEKVVCWGTGKPLREFLYVDDFAEACFKVLTEWEPNKFNSAIDNDGYPMNWINIGSKFEISIKELANKIANEIGYKGQIIWDTNMPDGTPRKKLDNEFINKLGWEAITNLDLGIKKTYASFKNELNSNILRNTN